MLGQTTLQHVADTMTPDADVSLSSGAESGSCDEDSDSHFELEGFLGQDEREDEGSDCSGCSTSTVRSSPRLALEAAAAAAEAAAAAAWETEHALPPAPSPLVDSDMEEGRSSGGAESPDAQSEVEFLGTTVAVRSRSLWQSTSSMPPRSPSGTSRPLRTTLGSMLTGSR